MKSVGFLLIEKQLIFIENRTYISWILFAQKVHLTIFNEEMGRLKVKAITLNEMLFVLAIIGALLLIAYPSFMPLITKAKAQEAKIQLSYIATLQTQYRYINSTYSNELSTIDFEEPKTVLSQGKANYRYEIVEASAGSFKARAEAVVDFDNDGTLNVWEIDENGKPKEIVKD